MQIGAHTNGTKQAVALHSIKETELFYRLLTVENSVITGMRHDIMNKTTPETRQSLSLLIYFPMNLAHPFSI